MSDLISRQAVLDAIVRHNDKNVLLSEWEMNGFVECIKALPSAPDSRQRGEWYRDSEGTWSTVDFAYCSECKQPIIHKHASPLWNFCPNCGCLMTKGD